MPVYIFHDGLIKCSLKIISMKITAGKPAGISATNSIAGF